MTHLHRRRAPALSTSILFIGGIGLLCSERVAAQTVELVANINVDVHNEPTSSNPSGFTVFNGELYFAAFSDTAGSSLSDRELWKTDGGAHTRVADVNPGRLVSSTPEGITVFNNHLYFAATAANGREPWKSDGLSAVQLADINTPGPIRSSNPAEFTPYAGDLYFAAETDDQGRELWKTDGTTLTMLSTMSDPHFDAASSDPEGFTLFNGELYFAANSRAGSGSTDRELWKTDGSALSRVADVNPGPFASSSPDGFTAFNGELYFAAASTNGRELWKSDGVTAAEVANIAPGPNNSSNPDEFTIFNGELYFAAETDDEGRELWKTDGTTLAMLSTITDPHFDAASSDPSDFTIFNGELYFAANSRAGSGSGSPRDRELWKTDGNTLTRVADVNPGPLASSDPDGLTVFRGELYFAATATNGRELWKTDGLVTAEVANIAPGPNRSSNPGEFTIFNGDLYFAATRPDDEGRELWRVVGVPEPSCLTLLLLGSTFGLIARCKCAATRFAYGKLHGE